MSNADNSRRRFFSFLAKALFTAISLCLAVPGVAYLGAPLRKKEGASNSDEGFVDAGALADLPVDKWQLLTVQILRKDGWEKTRIRCSVWVRREAGDQAVTVFSPLCPHLGCYIRMHPDQAQFICPCHKGTFDANGRTLDGPSPRSMDPLPFEVHAGRLWVRWQEFKTGAAERIPLSS
jgi:menaquinol-cytochrome c reductase iron-sulfur subunit